MTQSKAKELQQLQDVIAKAIKKVHGDKENDLCKYIPVSSGGYMHHFTMKKLKHKKPEELSSLIEKFILKTDRPAVVSPKPRAPRGSRKKRDQVHFTRSQLDKLLHMARVSGDKEMVSILAPKKSLAAYKRELIQSIRHGIVNEELWQGYVDAVHAQQAMLGAGAEIK